MRSMLYAGAALMFGASIYGFVDFNRTSHKKEFRTMYQEKKSEEKPGVKSGPAPAVESKMELADEVTKKEFTKSEKRTTGKAEAGLTPKPKKEIKKKRRFRFSEFSRAPLRDEDEKFLDEQETRKPDSTLKK